RYPATGQAKRTGDDAMNATKLLETLGLAKDSVNGGDLPVRSPVDGAEIARVRMTRPSELEAMIARAAAAFRAWRVVPAPRRGELIRLFGEELRRHKA